jgi:hypothetical protein
MEIKTLLVALKLLTVILIPPFDSMDTWEINEIPNQVQAIHKELCLRVSYEAQPINCEYNKGLKAYERILIEDSEHMRVCYLVFNVNEPKFAKSCAYRKLWTSEPRKLWRGRNYE